MAQFYQGPHFWDRRTYEVTVKTNQYRDRKQWIVDMKQWAKQRKIQIEWMGESTHTVNDDIWHEAHFYIPNEHNRMLFALRWS